MKAVAAGGGGSGGGGGGGAYAPGRRSRGAPSGCDFEKKF